MSVDGRSEKESRLRLWHLAALVAIAALLLALIRQVRSEWIGPLLLHGPFAVGLLL